MPAFSSSTGGSSSSQGPSSAAKAAPSSKAQKSSPVEVRSMSSPKPGWTIEAALQLLDDGYSAEQVERMTGFDARHVTAAAAAAAKANKPRAHGVVKPPEPVRRPEPSPEPAAPEPFWPDVD